MLGGGDVELAVAQENLQMAPVLEILLRAETLVAPAPETLLRVGILVAPVPEILQGGTLASFVLYSFRTHPVILDAIAVLRNLPAVCLPSVHSFQEILPILCNNRRKGVYL